MLAGYLLRELMQLQATLSEDLLFTKKKLEGYRHLVSPSKHKWATRLQGGVHEVAVRLTADVQQHEGDAVARAAEHGVGVRRRGRLRVEHRGKAPGECPAARCADAGLDPVQYVSPRGYEGFSGDKLNAASTSVGM
jgi:hypothetical protein